MDKQEDGGLFSVGRSRFSTQPDQRERPLQPPLWKEAKERHFGGIYRVPGTVFLHISIFLLFFISTIL